MKKIIGLLLLNIVFMTYSYAGFSVIRSSYGISLDRPKTQEQLITNTGDRDLQVKIYAAKPTNLVDEKLNMSDWVKVYPRYVTIPAHTSKKVRFIARPPKNLEAGEYRSVLYYEEVRNENDKRESMGFKLRLGTPIYGRTGNLTYIAEYSDLKFERSEKGYRLSGVAENTGNTSFTLRAKIKIFDKDGKLLKEADEKEAPLFRGSKGKIGIELEEVEKTSKVTVLFYEQNKKHRYEKSFEL
ncbi:hypothetical protein [Psychrilyobacter sp.]|uniref:hypothetical protein n=1 Tax=Psychrilyobacter sp. TaxID=2586924 RepID=UPI003019DA71